jgi:hypothetical protein
MAPYYNQGKEFRFENELDKVLVPFFQAIDLFDSRQADRRRLIALRATPEFQKAYAELGSPEIWSGYKPTTEGFQIIDPHETKDLHARLRKALKSKNRRAWRKHREKFVKNVLGEYRTVTDWICSVTFTQSVDTLMHRLVHSEEQSERQEALLKLTELEISFLTTPGAADTIRQAAMSHDDEFAAKLSRALDPKRQTKAYESQRQRHALMALSCFGFKEKSYRKWAKFFVYYNQQLGEPSGKPKEYAFLTYGRWQAIKEAIRAYGIPKNPVKPGRPKSRK